MRQMVRVRCPSPQGVGWVGELLGEAHTELIFYGGTMSVRINTNLRNRFLLLNKMLQTMMSVRILLLERLKNPL